MNANEALLKKVSLLFSVMIPFPLPAAYMKDIAILPPVQTFYPAYAQTPP